MNSFIWTNVVKSIDPALKQRMLDRKKITVSRKEYEIFCKEFMFDSLKEIGFGEAFCKRFNIDDSAISILKSESFAKELIESLGYIKNETEVH